MNNLIASSEIIAVIGMGETGLSVARYLRREQKKFIMLDTRAKPANLSIFLEEFPDQAYELGPLSFETLANVSKIVLSPGVAANDPVLQLADKHGIPVVGDIQLFAEHVALRNKSAQVVAITGSNAKSTVTTMVGLMVEHSGLNVRVGGNLSPPALDLLSSNACDDTDVFVLELSSFQLELTHNLAASVAVILNVSADHMDRYPSMQSYHAAKQRVFQKAKAIIANRADALTQPLLHEGVEITNFGLDQPDLNQFGVTKKDGRYFLAKGLKVLIDTREIKMAGQHNLANALAALALGDRIGLSMQEMLQVLKEFPGLEHRCQWVTCHQGVDYINDSKGTNVGATSAALQGLARLPSKIVLVAGGDGKGADFKELESDFSAQLRALVVMGKDAGKLESVAKTVGVDTYRVDSMQDAVTTASNIAEKGDLVLLSPACASLDMYNNYMERGNQFISAARGLTN